MERGGEPLRFLHLEPLARYALLGMRALAEDPGTGAFRLVERSAQRAGVSANMLAKVFQRLCRRGLLDSRRGPGGGYALARPAARIKLADIVRASQDFPAGGRLCPLRNRRCGEEAPCAVHGAIARADELARKAFESLTLADLATRA
ncbi:MAG: Rrf2 family transcriptional regulator [Elusimicrobia bacterium]|nr:Rrf2 family transcriptional regulator [Elusimicrobiota bacterium]